MRYRDPDVYHCCPLLWARQEILGHSRHMPTQNLTCTIHDFRPPLADRLPISPLSEFSQNSDGHLRQKMWNEGEARVEINSIPVASLDDPCFAGQPASNDENKLGIQSIREVIRAVSLGTPRDCVNEHHGETDSKDNQSEASKECANNGQPKRARKASKIIVSDESRKNMNKEAALKTRQQKRIEYAVLKAKMFLLRHENQKLREAAISRLPRSEQVVALLNSSFQIPFEVTALMRDYSAPDFSDLASMTSTVQSVPERTPPAQPRVKFSTRMEENISFCILDATTYDLRIKYASACYCTLTGTTNLVDRSFRDLLGPHANTAQFALLSEGLRRGRGTTIHVVHFSASGTERTMMVTLVHPKVHGSRVPFIIARHVESPVVHRPVLPFTVGSNHSNTSYEEYRSDASSSYSGINTSSKGLLYDAGRSQNSVTSVTSTSSSAGDVVPTKRRRAAVLDCQTRIFDHPVQKELSANHHPTYAIIKGPSTAAEIREKLVQCGSFGGHSHPLTSTLATASEESTDSILTGRMLAEFLLSPDAWECYDVDGRGANSPRASHRNSRGGSPRAGAGSTNINSGGSGSSGVIAGDHVASLGAVMYERSANAYAEQQYRGPYSAPHFGQYQQTREGQPDEHSTANSNNNYDFLQNLFKF